MSPVVFRCPKPRCRNPLPCPVHGRKKEHDRERDNAARRGYGSRWRRYRLLFLTENPMCVLCRSSGHWTAATVVDHIVPHKGDVALFWDAGNHRALCKPCHDKHGAK